MPVNTVSKLRVSVENTSLSDEDTVKSSSIQDESTKQSVMAAATAVIRWRIGFFIDDVMQDCDKIRILRIMDYGVMTINNIKTSRCGTIL